MKILEITNSEGLSGGVFQMLELTKILIKKGLNVEIACRPTSKIKEKAVELNIKHSEFPLENDPDVRSMYQLFRHLRRGKYDVVHAHHPKAHMIAMIASFFARTPVFVVSRRVSFSIKEGKGKLNPLKYRFFRVNMIIPVADAIRDLMIKEGINEKKLRTVRSGTDPVRFNPDTVKSDVLDELGIRDGETVVTKIAHYSSWKGYDCFFKAAKRVIEGGHNVKFVIAGKGTDSKDVQDNLAKMGLTDRFHCLGMRSDVPEILKASDIAVNSAYEGEGLSGALREALFMGVPVIASDIAGNGEICIPGKTGILFHINDDAALADAIITLISDPAMRDRMSAYGRELMQKEFTTEVMAEKTLAIYEELLSKKRK